MSQQVSEETTATTGATKDDSKSMDDRWECHRCKILNPSSRWRCTACFADRKVSKDEFENSIPSKMKGLIKLKEGQGFEYTNDLTVPEVGDGEVLVKSQRVGICGSDIILHDWTKQAALIAKVPFTPGHEASGLIVRVGNNTSLKVGQRVAIENHFFCGKCYQCKHQRKDICGNMSQFGHGKGTTQGGCSDYFVVREEYCYRLRKNSTTWRDAALLEPLGVAVNACNRVGIKPNMFGKNNDNNNYNNNNNNKNNRQNNNRNNKNNSNNNNTTNEDEKMNVLVIGAGTIGCLAVGVCKAYGGNNINIYCIDLIDWKLEIASKYGAKVINVSSKEYSTFESKYNNFLKLTNGVGFDKIIECSGHSGTISEMFKYLRKGGEAVLVGLPKEDLKFDAPMPDLIFKSLTIHSIHGRRIFDTWKQAEQLVYKKLINLDYVVTQEIPLTHFKEGYDKLKSGKALKVLFDPTK